MTVRLKFLMASIESTCPLRTMNFIVAERLHLEIIVIIGNAEQLFVGLTGHDCPVKLTCFTGRGEQQALAVTGSAGCAARAVS